ncbi:VanZ family protein [Streptococcus hyovaginalis]
MRITKFFNHMLDHRAQLKSGYRPIVFGCLILYLGFVMALCFSPQADIVGVSTPNIIYWGRLRLLLVPFNTLISFSRLETAWEVVWVTIQNLLNIFLLYPLAFAFYLLRQKWYSFKQALLLGLCLSACIEITQLALDLAFDFNRVFEIDDLWTNALGVGLAYLSVHAIRRKHLIQSGYNRESLYD